MDHLQAASLFVSEERTDVDAFCHTYNLNLARFLKELELVRKTRGRQSILAVAEYSQPVTVKQFGKYTVTGELGRGGCGIVYKAVDNETPSREVALKVVHRNTPGWERFVLEGKALNRIENPNVVTRYDWWEDAERGYLVMELCSGGSLAQRMRPSGVPYSHPSEVAKLIRDIAKGISEAHKQGITHRDLKPGNIVFAADGTPKVVDFGLARPSWSDRLTEPGDVVGTPDYMAPEQIRGDTAKIGPCTDVWALGVIMYELLTGRHPFRGKDKVDLVNSIARMPPRAPSSVVRNLPAGLEAICLKCLESKPSHRYPSASALVRDLESFLHNQPVYAPRLYLTKRFKRWWIRHPVLAPMLVVIHLALVTVTIEAVLGFARIATEKRTATEARVKTLINAAPDAVPGMLSELDGSRETILPYLRSVWAGGSKYTRRQRMRAGLAILPLEPDATSDPLFDWLLQTDDPAEVLIVRDALRDYSERIRERCWATIESTEASSATRFHAMVALAAFDPKDRRWQAYAPLAVAQLLESNPLHLGTWVKALEPVHDSLIQPLQEVFHKATLSERREIAARVLVTYVADREDGIDAQ